MSMPQNGIDEFKEVVGDFRSVTSLVAKGAVVAPFADILLRQFDSGIAPAWPSGILIITSVAELVSLIFIFHFFFRTSRKKLNKIMLVAIVVLSITFVSYLFTFSRYTRTHPKTNKQIVLGYEPVTEDIGHLLAEGYTPDEALAGSEYAPEKIWTERSITYVRLIIVLLWLAAFISLAVFIGLFVMSQRRIVVNEPD